MKFPFLTAVWLLLAIMPVAHAGDIATKDDLVAYSDITSDPGYYILLSGNDYRVTAPITISGDSRNSISFTGSGDTLTLAAVDANPLLTVDRFNLSGGAAVIATGTDIAGAAGYGLSAAAFTISGPSGTTLTAQGGTVASAQGVRVGSGGFAQNGGTVFATGGSGSTSDGIHSTGGYVMTNGTLTATGGASNAAGVRVTNGAFTVKGGTITATGGTGGNSTGIWVTSGKIVVEAGDITANGSTTSDNAHGLLTANELVMTNGTLTATGGTASFSTGITAQNGATLSGGTMTVTGGSGAQAHGLATNGKTVTVEGSGHLIATAGGLNNVHGVFTNTFVQNGGTIEAFAGTTAGAYGMTGNTFTQNGGSLVAIGSTSGDSRGVSYYTVRQNNGSITARGGSANASTGSATRAFFASYFTQVGGEINAEGGTGNGAAGVTVNFDFIQSGDVTASGGSGVRSHGMDVGSWSMSVGSATLTGGDGSRAYGLSTGRITQDSGTISAKGGNGDDAYGLYGSSGTITGGSMTGEGGGGANSDGVYLNTISLDGATLGGTGGAASGSNGVNVARLDQLSGSVVAQAGTVDGAYGIRTGYLEQKSGNMVAIGGVTANGYGLYVSTDLDIYGKLRLERPEQNGASVFVGGYGTGLTLHSGSILEPVVDIDVLDSEKGSGLILTASGSDVTIADGARVTPWFVDHRSIRMDTVYTDYLFINTDGGQINGTFANEHSGLTIEYIVRKSDDNSQYWISYERVLEIPDVLDKVPCTNARRLLEMFEELYNPNDALVAGVISDIDHSQDWADLYRISARIGRTLIPLAYTKLTGTQLRTMELMQSDVLIQLGRLSDSRPYLNQSGGDGFASLADHSREWHVWANALYQQSSRFAATCIEYDSPKEKLYGVSTGMGRDFGRIAVAGAFGYVRGTYKSGYTDTSIDNYGITLGARLHDIVPKGFWFTPYLALVGGYAYGDIDQKALNYLANGWKTSSPSARMFRASLELGNELPLTESLTVTPFIGLDYAHIRQSGYRERDASGYGSRVFTGSYDSLRPRAGLEVDYRVTDKLTAGIKAQYRYETMDSRSSFDYSRLTAPDTVLRAQGESRKRFSGSVGASADYRVSDTVSLRGGYDLVLEHKYRANRFSAGLAVQF